MKQVLVSWSSGQRLRAWALHLLRQESGIEVVGLLTTINAHFDRVAMHGTRRAILEAQASAAQLPLWAILSRGHAPTKSMSSAWPKPRRRALAEDIDAIAFGDLFLPDVRAYRETQLKPTGLGTDLPALANTHRRTSSRIYDRCFRRPFAPSSSASTPINSILSSPAATSMPICSTASSPHPSIPAAKTASSIPCVFDGPMFSTPIALEPGEIVDREGFIYADFALQKAPAPLTASTPTSR